MWSVQSSDTLPDSGFWRPSLQQAHPGFSPVTSVVIQSSRRRPPPPLLPQ